MYNIHDWTISRQLWWGHRIPVWHCTNNDCGEVIVARETPKSCSKCGGAKLEQDTDVLDTWFSSGLLPFTTLGWPEKTRDQEVFYPTTLLITAYEILFFWVAAPQAKVAFFGTVPSSVVIDIPVSGQITVFGSGPRTSKSRRAFIRSSYQAQVDSASSTTLPPKVRPSVARWIS